MLAAILITAIYLAVMEIVYVHSKFFEGRLGEFIRILLPFVISGVFICDLEIKFGNTINGYISFALHGIFYVTINTLIAFIVSLLCLKSLLIAVMKRIKPIYQGLIKR